MCLKFNDFVFDLENTDFEKRMFQYFHQNRCFMHNVA